MRSTLRHSALELFRAALNEADPEKAVLKAKLGAWPRTAVSVIAVGKAAPAMFRGLARQVRKGGGSIELVWMVSPFKKPGRVPKNVRWLYAEHPLPGPGSMRATREIEEALQSARPGARWVILLSGGASSLLGAPREGLTLGDLQKSTRSLLRSGAPIDKINAVRGHLTRLGGGGLWRKGLRMLTLALSDVPGDRGATIGSGPTSRDQTTFKECLKIINKYDVKLPPNAHAYLKAGARGLKPETCKSRLPEIKIVGSASQSLRAAAQKARALGYRPVNQGVKSGDLKKSARQMVRRAAHSKTGTCFLSGGELTSRVIGKGQGGRNQEFVLAALLELSEANLFIFSAGTDGRDGNTTAAGAWADWGTLRRARSLGLDPKRFLKNNDSHAFFKKVGGIHSTGATGTNVMDFRVLIKLPKARRKVHGRTLKEA